MKLKKYLDFIKENYDDDSNDPEWDGIERHEGNENLFIDSTGRYDSTGQLELKMSDTLDGKLLYQFVKFCKQDIDIDNLNLTTLEGLPESYAESIKCSDNELTSLIGSPKRIGTTFIAEGNKLTTLEGSPEKCEEFYCGHNDDLTSLKGSPVKVIGYFNAANNKNLTSLESNLMEVSIIDIRNCPKLTSLKGLPKIISGSLDISGCTEIKTLYDISKCKISHLIDYDNTKITDTEYKYFTNAYYSSYKDSYENYYKGLIKFIKYKYNDADLKDTILNDINNIYIPEDIMNQTERNNFIKSLKTVSKFNL